jgi:hypothetical protein
MKEFRHMDNVEFEESFLPFMRAGNSREIPRCPLIKFPLKGCLRVSPRINSRNLIDKIVKSQGEAGALTIRIF